MMDLGPGEGTVNADSLKVQFRGQHLVRDVTTCCVFFFFFMLVHVHDLVSGAHQFGLHARLFLWGAVI